MRYMYQTAAGAAAISVLLSLIVLMTDGSRDIYKTIKHVANPQRCPLSNEDS